MKHLTIRDLPGDLARALESEKRRRGQSLNQTVKDVLRVGLSLDREPQAGNGLGRLAGTWTAEDLAEFEQATAVFERVDEEAWK